jgi:hypothetical protein
VDSQIVTSEKPLANVLKPNVRFGSKADMNACPRDVRFTPRKQTFVSANGCVCLGPEVDIFDHFIGAAEQ